MAKGAGVYSLSTETAGDAWEVEALYDVCFAPGREALPSYRLRDGVARVGKLCLVARDSGGVLAAAVRYWPVVIGGRPALLLGPIGVHPTRQGEGLGALLIGDSLERARRAGWHRVLLVGDASYYGRFGFSRLDGVVMPAPANPDRVLGVALSAGAWDGVKGAVMRAA
jgi:predicted N-acetyltransferase YhbS